MAERDASVGRLERALSERSVLARTDAAQALGRMLAGRRRAPRKLLAASGDPNWLVRATVAEALLDIGDPSASTRLRRLLEDPHPIVRSYAATAVAAVVGRPSRPWLRAALARERSSLARVGLTGALVGLGDREHLDAILGLLRSRRYRVRCAAANTLSIWLKMPADARALAVAELQSALAEEQTVAARSTMMAALRVLRRRVR